MFDNMIARIHEEMISLLLRVNIEQAPLKRESQAEETGASLAGDGKRKKPKKTITAAEPGRNERCPCGSGRKYKQCCMSKAS